MHSLALALWSSLTPCSFSADKLKHPSRHVMLVVGFTLFPLSTFCLGSICSVILLTGESRDGVLSNCIPSNDVLSGDVMKWLAPAKGFSEECERWTLRCSLNTVKSWRRAGVEATIMPMFCSTLRPHEFCDRKNKKSYCTRKSHQDQIASGTRSPIRRSATRNMVLGAE